MIPGRSSFLPAGPVRLSKRRVLICSLFLILLVAAIKLTPPVLSRPAARHLPKPMLSGLPIARIVPACPLLRPDPSFGISLIDVQTGQPLCERNANGIAQPASTTKVMAALLTGAYLHTHHLTLDTLITAQGIDKHVEWDASVAYIQVGQSYSVRTLLSMVSMLSAADATMALARFVAGSRAAFLALMNQQARRLGMNHTHYTSPYGYANTSSDHWQQGEQPSVGNCSSAHDMALLMRAFAQYPDLVVIFGATTYHEGSIWLSRAKGYIITDSWLGLSTADGVRANNLHLPFQVLAVKRGCMWCEAAQHKISYVLLARFQQQVISAAFLYTTQSYANPLVGDMLPTLLWVFHQCNQPAYARYCQM
jgi:D-alanyl-D-alanine carboxypeptidase